MSVMFDLALVPYNGFLPEITTPQTINRVSAFGFSMGYLGGSIPLAATLGLVKFGPQFGLDAELQHRAALLLLGAWWGGFTLPALLVLRDRGPRRRQSLPAAAREALTEVGRTLASVRRFPALAWFLLAFLFYNDGMQTVITQANTLASKDFQFTLEELCVFVLVIQLVALPSSLAVGWLADRVGVKPTLLGCLTVWLGLLLGVAVVSSAIQFWVLGIVLATVLGGTQAVSRAAVGLMTPARRAAEFFGFFNVSGKAAAFLGPVLFASVYGWTQSTRAAAASIIPFFLVGGAIVAAINFAAGRRQALEPNPETDSS
jgi:UMF1 family MFS transporter